MNKGLWVWPAQPRAQRRVLRQVADSPHLVSAMAALAKSKEGLSNAELDDIVGDNSEWMTLWVIKQLTALGFIDFNVDFFGNPARYKLTELGRTALSIVTGQPPQPRPPTPQPAQQVAPAPKPAAAPTAA